MTAKEYLNQYRRIIIKAELLELDIEALEAGIGAMPAPKDPDMPHMQTTRNTTEDTLVMLIDMKRDKENMLAEAKAKAAEISGTIERLSEIDDRNAATYMQLLYDKYILLMRWPEIAKAMNYTEQHVRGYLHGKALLAISDLIGDVNTN